jgi:DedD protein
MAEQQQDVETLKRRGRRRLVGAVALVLAAVIVLPMVFDPEPRPSAPPVSARIPGEDETPFKPKAKAPEKKEVVVEKKTAEKKEAPKPEVPKPEAKEKARAEAAIAGSEYVVQVGAFTTPDNVIAKLAAAKIPYFTEPVQGKGLTRVRAGPFPTQDAAQKALEKLRGMGFEPGPVTMKAG